MQHEHAKFFVPSSSFRQKQWNVCSAVFHNSHFVPGALSRKARDSTKESLIYHNASSIPLLHIFVSREYTSVVALFLSGKIRTVEIELRMSSLVMCMQLSKTSVLLMFFCFFYSQCTFHQCSLLYDQQYFNLTFLFIKEALQIKTNITKILPAI